MKKIKKLIREENFLSLAGNLAIALFGLLGFAVLARTYSIDQFGEWVLFLSAGSFLEMFRFGITNTALIRYLSGADEELREKLIGSNAVISVYVTLGLAIILAGCNLFFHNSLAHSGYGLFFTWYPVLAIVNLPWNNALVVLQADRSFGKIFLLKAFNSGIFFLSILINFLMLHLSVNQMVIILLIINVITSIMSFFTGWDGLTKIRKAEKHTTSLLLHFGKYTTFTLVGTNLLRSADTLIISLSPMGSAAVALYSIPMKLTELQQIPLRSFTATAFPKMSKASLQGKLSEVKEYFYQYAGAITYLFLFVSLFTFLFADYFVVILAGKKYLAMNLQSGSNAASIVRVFSLYGLLLPIDRMTGIGLDSINRPHVNAIKVGYMLLANVIGDLIAVYIFHSLLLVAVASILFTILGIWIGMHFLNRELSLSYRQIFSSGIQFYKTLYQRTNKHIYPKMANS